MANHRPQLELMAPSASTEEAAAIVAALEQFLRATAPAQVSVAESPDPWARAAILEGVMREDRLSGRGATNPWSQLAIACTLAPWDQDAVRPETWINT